MVWISSGGSLRAKSPQTYVVLKAQELSFFDGGRQSTPNVSSHKPLSQAITDNKIWPRWYSRFRTARLHRRPFLAGVLHS